MPSIVHCTTQHNTTQPSKHPVHLHSELNQLNMAYKLFLYFTDPALVSNVPNPGEDDGCFLGSHCAGL